MSEAANSMVDCKFYVMLTFVLMCVCPLVYFQRLIECDYAYFTTNLQRGIRWISQTPKVLLSLYKRNCLCQWKNIQM